MELPARPIDYASIWNNLPDGDVDTWTTKERSDDSLRYDLLCGKLVPLSISDIFHQGVTFSLIAWTIQEAQKDSSETIPWTLLESPRLRLGDDILVADIAGWRTKAYEVASDALYHSRAPDWVCLNKRHSYEDYLPTKRETLLRQAGIDFFWDVDVSGKDIKAYKLKNGRWSKAGKMMARGKFRAQPFPDLKFNPENLWR